MPTYEYECGSCGHKFEVFQSITDRPRRKCPVCSKRIRRLISAGGAIIFKGSGFYQTDYRSPEYQKRAKSESSNGSKEKGSDSSKKKDTEGGC